MKASSVDPSKFDEKWLLGFLRTEFKKSRENITPFKILSKLGVNIRNQSEQLKNRALIHKLILMLNILHKQGLLDLKHGRHDTLGIKERAYRFSQNEEVNND